MKNNVKSAFSVIAFQCIFHLFSCVFLRLIKSVVYNSCQKCFFSAFQLHLKGETRSCTEKTHFFTNNEIYYYEIRGKPPKREYPKENHENLTTNLFK